MFFAVIRQKTWRIITSATLTEKQKEQFALCGERRNELLTVFEKAAFIRGFRLGARMAAEVLSD